MMPFAHLAPSQLRPLEGLRAAGLRNPLGMPPECGKLPPASFRDSLCHLRLFMVREVLKWRGRGEHLALYHHRYTRCGHDVCAGVLRPCKVCYSIDAVAQSAVSNL